MPDRHIVAVDCDQQGQIGFVDVLDKRGQLEVVSLGIRLHILEPRNAGAGKGADGDRIDLKRIIVVHQLLQVIGLGFSDRDVRTHNYLPCSEFKNWIVTRTPNNDKSWMK